MKPCLLCAALIACALPMESRAQLVADGQTNVLNGVSTNIAGEIVVGTNGPFTLVIITNGATVTNSGGNVTIGSSVAANTNRVVVTGAGSMWQDSGNFYVGLGGSANELDILNGGQVRNAVGSVGQDGRNNFVLVSGAGSSWTNTGSLYLGNGSSPGNTLVVSNGGKLFNASASLGNTGAAGSNIVVITGPGSSWSSGYLYVGYSDSKGHDQVFINNGGSLVESSTMDIGVYSSFNSLTVADAGSSLLCQTFRIGYSSASNQCIVSNGATLTVTMSGQPTTVEGTSTVATITGEGSVWTNAGDFDFGQTSDVLAITGGGTLVNQNGYIGNGFGKSNTVTVAGANSAWVNLNDLHVKDVGAQLTITNGGMVTDNYGYLGDSTGNNNCHALVSGAGSVWTNRYDLYVGNNGATNQLVVSNSGTVFAQNVYLGGSSSSTSNNLVLNGGNLITANGSGKIYVQWGTLTLDSGLVNCGTLEVFNGSRFVFNGGTLQAYGVTMPIGSALAVGDGVDAAILMLTNAYCEIPAGLVISSNAVLTGNGTMGGNVTVAKGGTFAPGTANPQNQYMTFYNGLVLQSGCTTVMSLQPPNVYSNYYLTGLTNIVYGGTLQLTNIGGAFAAGLAYKIFSAAHYSGAFGNLVPATPGPGLRWDTSELTVDGVLRIFPTGSQPPILGGNVAVANGNLIVSASAGIPYDPVYLLTSTNAAMPVANWTACSTNYFDTNGTVSITNAIVVGEPQRYFRLQVQ